jgi:hypothetical protein
MSKLLENILYIIFGLVLILIIIMSIRHNLYIEKFSADQ